MTGPRLLSVRVPADPQGVVLVLHGGAQRGERAAVSPPPIMDVAWSLDRVAEEHGDVPVALVGHSLGGRAALLGGDAPQVRTVVALNPWDGAAFVDG